MGVDVCALKDLVEGESRPRKSVPMGPVWLLNLDHVESGTGRIIRKDFVSPDRLGTSTHAFERGTVLYSKLRPYLNKVVVADGPGYATTELVPLRCNAGRVIPEYLAYFLRSPQFLGFASAVVAGAKMPRMVMSEFWSYELPVPPLPEQRRIVAILDQADALKAKRREALTHLGSLTQSMFVEMFGDPSVNPRRWPVKALAELVADNDTINYGVVQPGDDVEQGVPLIRVGDLIGGRIRHAFLKRIDASIEATYRRSRLRGDEILVSCVGSVGVVALASAAEKGFNIARAVARVRLTGNSSRMFVAAQLQSESVQRYFTQELRTVSQPTLNIKQLAETRLIFPPLELQLEFEARLEALETARRAQENASTMLEELFASLQQHAFHGRL